MVLLFLFLLFLPLALAAVFIYVMAMIIGVIGMALLSMVGILVTGIFGGSLDK